MASGASGLVHFDEEGERNLDYSIYDLQNVEGVTKFVPILHFDSNTKAIRYCLLTCLSVCFFDLDKSS